ncbi:MAG: AarF/UbiB family protein [Bacteroidales bacterium]|nr:AarF/UbiB family protein [Bacteroidales bacterium]
MKDKKSGKLHAVKCFLKDQEGREERYRKISNYLETIENRYLIKTKFLEKELFVDTKSTDQTEFPVVVMDWVEGVPLDVYIREKINDKMYLEYLCYTFSLMAQNLIEQEFAHGDLKPDNILVKEDGMLVLVDYDGMYVPEMFGERSRELGSPDFQHPDRKLIDFDKHLDDFSLASILLSLKLISIAPSLLDKFGDKDRLLFSQKDYRNFYTSEINKVIVDYFEIKEVYNLYCLFIQGLGRKMIVWGKEMWKLEVPEMNVSYNRKEKVFLLSKLAEYADDAKAFYGYLLLEGDLCDVNLDKGLSYLLELAFKENTYAQVLLAKYYKSKETSESLLTKSAGLGNPMAQFLLSERYKSGTGVKRDARNRLFWLFKSAEQGYSYAQKFLGIFYSLDPVFKNDEKAFEWAYRSAKQGNIYCYSDLGAHYSYGKGVVRDLDKAIEFFTKVAELGDASDKFNLGFRYENGMYNIPPNTTKAFEWYTISAELGYEKAQYKLALCYENGKGVEKSFGNALEWYKKSADQGNAEAQFKLSRFFEYFLKSPTMQNAEGLRKVGLCYELGYGVDKDLEKAFDYYSRSAEEGDSRALYRLAGFYDKGVVVEQDVEKATLLYKQSADRCDPDALFIMSERYKNGIGVQVDLEKSKEYHQEFIETICCYNYDWNF